MTKLADMVRAFAREEDGIALTEYLILLGLLVGGVIVVGHRGWKQPRRGLGLPGADFFSGLGLLHADSTTGVVC